MNRLSRYSLTLFLFLHLIAPVSEGQMSFLSDTVRIKEIIVNAGLLSEISDAYTQFNIDTNVLTEKRHGSISEIIAGSGYLYIKSYGPGGIATPAFRGTGASHTQLSWNGLNINSPMLGQADLSLIPGGFIDDLNIYSGLASLAISSGGLGGTIDFRNNPDWSGSGLFTAGYEAGSFGNNSLFTKLTLGGSRFISVTRAFMQSGDNDFPYLDNVNSNSPEYEKRINADYMKKGLLQEFYLRDNRSVTSARVWYQLSDRNLPAPLLMPQVTPGESQSDQFFRTILNHRRFYPKSKFDLTAALFSDRLDYLNETVSIDSRNHSLTLISKAGYERDLGRKTHLEILISNEYSRINSVNYSDIRSRSLSGLTTAARKSFGDNFGFVLLLRQMITAGRVLKPDFSAGADFRIIKGKEAWVKINVARNSKVPSLNDLYWNPGGNTGLKNEYCSSFEIMTDVSGKLGSNIKMESAISLFTNLIRDMIQWKPGEYNYWSPQNLGSVNAYGFETDIKLDYDAGRVNGRIGAHYSFTRSEEAETEGAVNAGKQLIYIPVNQFNVNARIGYRIFFFQWITSYTGIRYISTDNADSLPAYALSDISGGMKIKAGKTSSDIKLRVENLFDKVYQTVAYQPMPMRSYHLSLTFNFLK